MIYLFNIAIFFHSYVKLPKGIKWKLQNVTIFDTMCMLPTELLRKIQSGTFNGLLGSIYSWYQWICLRETLYIQETIVFIIKYRGFL